MDFVSRKDIPGTNIPGEHPGNDGPDDTEVFADKKALYVGHIIGGIVAETPLIARRAAKLVKIEYKKLDPILSIKVSTLKILSILLYFSGCNQSQFIFLP